MMHKEALFPDSTKWTDGILDQVGGRNLKELAEKFGTPLYVYDGVTFSRGYGRLKDLLNDRYHGPSTIAYASKAYLSFKFARKLQAIDAAIDVVSTGELNVALEAGISPDRIHLHGNNKSELEIRQALNNRIASIVIDSFDELQFVEAMAAKMEIAPSIWIRINPDIEVDTHSAIQTGHGSSKFGIPITGGLAANAIQAALKSRMLNLTGIHTHLGSQIFDAKKYRMAIKTLMDLCRENGWMPESICPGGGWGVPYREDILTGDPSEWISEIGSSIEEWCEQNAKPLPELVIEPGRWLIARAGVAIYQVGATKKTPDGIHIVALDGGMADNPRPGLYDAVYTAELIGSPAGRDMVATRLVGRYCESGDELIHHIVLPELQRGDLIAVPVSGAYQLSMASNYNLTGRPCVLWLEDDRVEILQKREEIHQSAWWMGM